MTFGEDPQIEHRWINFGWGPRAENAEQIARRLRAMAGDLRRVEPDLNPLWLQFSSRATRPTDPERVDELPVDDLARLIDRRARFDPPPYPAPVGPEGYKLRLGGPPSEIPSHQLYISMYAGIRSDGWPGNGGVLNLLEDGPIWQTAERGMALIRALVGAWEPDGAGAYGRRRRREGDPDNFAPPVRPWVTWNRQGVDYEFYKFTDVGPPALTLDELGGRLRVWP